jgi:conjugative relaxase-like TrwC/TraI family protein
MLSRGKVTPATVAYYTSEVASGLEDYYAGRGEPEGRWLGGGSSNEGLAGTVSAGELERLFRAEHPATGEPLGGPYVVRPGADRVTGWDLTFSAPKTVSVLWAVGGATVAMDVREAHDAAVQAGIAYLEEHAAFSRTGKAGVRQVDTQGLVAAGFLHRQSRAGDPQVHTHVLVSGRVRCLEDDVWRALDSRALHRQLKPAGMVYQAALRAELTARLGVAWTPVDRHGQAEIEGVPDALRRLFSQRRTMSEVRAAELLATRREELGRDLTPSERRSLFQQAVLDTRSAKDHAGDDERGLHDRWIEEAVDAGLAPERWVRDSLDRSPDRSRVQLDDIVLDLEEASSTWRRSDIVRTVARHVPPTVGSAAEARAWVEATTDAVLAHPDVVCLSAPRPRVPGELRRRDGSDVFDRHDAPRFTTTATLRLEADVLALVEAGRAAGRAVVPSPVLTAAQGRHPVSEDQAAAIEVLARSGDALSCIVGPAGAGKSRLMRCAADSWAAAGVPVRGLAVSAVAAGVLTEEAGVHAETIARFLLDHAHGRTSLRPGEVVIVDEAGMVSTRDLARLLHVTESATGKLVLVGDPAQLGPVEAGGLFRLLADTGAVGVTTIRRFEHPWEANRSLRLRKRDLGALEVYEQHGRIQNGDRVALLDHAADSWIAARARGESVVVTASTNDTVAAICQRVRDRRVLTGDVEAHGVVCDGHPVGIGDEVVTLKNRRDLRTDSGAWVRNGDRWAVTAHDPDGALTLRSIVGRGCVQLPASYATDHVHLAYALTIHKSQGVTVDRAITVVDEATTAEALYVGMTRGRHENLAFVCHDAVDLDHPRSPAEPLDVLRTALARTSAEEAATAVLRRALAAEESLATLVPRLASIDAQIARQMPPDVSAELDALTRRRAGLELKPGSLTARARHDRRVMQELDGRKAELERRVDARRDWLVEHQPLLDHRAQLSDQITDRRRILGAVAAADPPKHIVERLGPLPGAEADRRTWVERVEQIEAYRERWGVEPDDLRTAPVDGLQRAEWYTAVRSTDLDRASSNVVSSAHTTRVSGSSCDRFERSAPTSRECSRVRGRQPWTPWDLETETCASAKAASASWSG